MAVVCGSLSAATLYLMWRMRQFTNYFVVHTVWTEIVVIGTFFEVVLGGVLSLTCTGIYVRVT